MTSWQLRLDQIVKSVDALDAHDSPRHKIHHRLICKCFCVLATYVLSYKRKYLEIRSTSIATACLWSSFKLRIRFKIFMWYLACPLRTRIWYQACKYSRWLNVIWSAWCPLFHCFGEQECLSDPSLHPVLTALHHCLTSAIIAHCTVYSMICNVR